MTRYIDADALKKDISEWCYVIGKPHLLGRAEVMTVIDGSITANVVEVVRCRDCKHRVEGSKICAHPKAVGWDAIEPEDDDFCSYGERRAENA